MRSGKFSGILHRDFDVLLVAAYRSKKKFELRKANYSKDVRNSSALWNTGFQPQRPKCLKTSLQRWYIDWVQVNLLKRKEQLEQLAALIKEKANNI